MILILPPIAGKYFVFSEKFPSQEYRVMVRFGGSALVPPPAPRNRRRGQILTSCAIIAK